MNHMSLLTIFSKDMERSCDFYSKLLDLPEKIPSRSPIYRAIDGGNLEIGFHKDDAYDVLGLRDRQPKEGAVNILFTFYVASREAIDELAERAQALGGKVVKPAYDTYYNHYQVVLSDPDDTVFRLSYPKG